MKHKKLETSPLLPGENDFTKPTKNDLEENEQTNQHLSVGVLQVFRYATAGNVFLMLVGSLCACAHGVIMPALFVLIGRLMDTFVNSAIFQVVINRVSLEQFNLTAEETKRDPSLLKPLYPLLKNITNGYLDLEAHPEAPTYDIVPDMMAFATYTGIAACVVIFLGYAQVAFWRIAAENQVRRIRLMCFQNLMRQEISYFDCHSTGDINNRLIENVTQIEAGIGDTVGTLLQWLSSSISGYVFGFYYGWEYALVLLCGSPLQALSTFLLVKVASSMTRKELDAYSKAGAVAQETLQSIRTVVAFGGESTECERYDTHIQEARRCGERKGLIIGFAIGFTWCMKYLVYALGIWYGVKILAYQQDSYSPGTIMMVFMCMSFASFSLGFMLPSIELISTARTAAYTVFEMINRVSDIDSSSDARLQPKTSLGTMEICNVHFHYPSRPEDGILKGLNLHLTSGETMAVVGPSGCGKTTIAQLLLRFYDPINGQVRCDGADIQELNVKWLRHQIGIVGQEPVLFATSVSENIRHGWDDASYSDIEQAARMANAHGFIMTLPQKYDTLVGEGGSQLSGGQKQRIAIARALIRNPKILLLDEATSAMDSENEAIVQEAIDRVSKGRTTLIIAHRLSTIRSADKIAAMRDGVITELGTHDELMAKNGVYKNLIMNQMEAISEAQDILDQKHGFIEKIDVSLYDPETNEVKADSEKEKEEKIHASALMGLFRMNAREWPFIVAGCVACMISGAVQPAFGVTLSSSFSMFQIIDTDERFRESRWYILAFVIISVVALVSMTMKSYLFAKSGEALTLKIRQKLFKIILHQEIGWFDKEENNTGILTYRLSADASHVHGITGVRMGLVLQSISSLGIGLGVAMYYGWKLALVILAFVPFIVFAAMFEMIILRGAAGKNDRRVEKAGEIAKEVIDSIRTVAMFSREDYFYERYKAKLKGDNSPCIRRSHLTGLSFSLTQCLLYLSYCATLTYGGYLVQSGEMTYDEVFRVFIVISLSAVDIGKSNVFVPNATKAKASAAKIIQLLDRLSLIDASSPCGEKPREGDYDSRISFHDVTFCYPRRPNIEVLKCLKLSVRPGETLAIVGGSGCGKSTCVRLMERFYDPTYGTIYLDNYDVKLLNIKWLRRQFGLVSQEPVLFDRSISENIAFGDNGRNVLMTDVIAVARFVNIHGFIEKLPDGYHTNCGEKGTQLSGGQKQLVAIARALVRNPKILLLDEATSALDAENERIVQEALDKARFGRTCIIIAHRLSTVRNADRIAVIHNGQVAELGTHHDLIANRGVYYKLIKAQMPADE